MASNAFYLFHLHPTSPYWEYFDGERSQSCAPPQSSSRKPVVALLPDSLLFYFSPRNMVAKGRRAVRAATDLQMKFHFPGPAKGAEQGTIVTPSGAILGYMSHPQLPKLWEAHKHVLERANVVTSPFLMAHASASVRKLENWIWNGCGPSGESTEEAQQTTVGPRAVVAGGNVGYFQGNDAELVQRVAELELAEPPAQLGWDDVLTDVASPKIPLARLRLPLHTVGEDQTIDHHVYIRLIIAIALIGFFFCAGEFWRWYGVQSQVGGWKEAVKKEYSSVLGSDNVKDPLGKLLFKMDQLKGSKVVGLDILGLLSFMSKVAPQGMYVESVALANESGTIRARIQSYQQLETMLAELKKSTTWAFVLEQANNTEDGVFVILRVELNEG